MSGRWGRLAFDAVLKAGFGVKVGQDFYRPQSDEQVEVIEELPGGNVRIRMTTGRWKGASGVAPKRGVQQ